MYYLYLHIIGACLKIAIVMFYFAYLKNPSNMKNIFNFISAYSWKKISLLANIRNKYFMRKVNLYVFAVMKNSQIFPSKVCHFQYDHRFFLVEKWWTLGRWRRYNCKNLFNLDYQDSICFAIYQAASKWRIIYEEFNFSTKCFDRNFKSLFQKRLNLLSCTLAFLYAMAFRRFITH